MNDGVRVFNMEPLVEKLYLNKEQVGSVEIVEMLNRSNLIAIVPGGNHPIIGPNSVLIWDDKSKQFVMELTFKSKVYSVKMSQTKIVVVLRSKIHVFSFPNACKKLFTFDTCDNPKGLCELSNNDEGCLCFPSVKSGFIQIADINQTEESLSKCPKIFQAHRHDIACMALDTNVSLLASASSHGTLIRVFDIKSTSDVKLLIDFRRGMEAASLYSINFSRDSSYLCASSNKGTVHIFNIQDPQCNRQLKLAKLGLNSGSILESKWAMCNFQVPCELPCVCTFGDNYNSVFCVCVNGSYYKYMFSSDGKTCTRDAFENFLDISLGSDF